MYLTDRCNSRCVSCDYWRTGRVEADANQLRALLPELRALDVRVVLLSGGEPLLHPEWASIAGMLRDNGQRVWLLTAGLSLYKHAQRASELFDAITVSLDGTDAAGYARIRGVDAFAAVCRGVRAAAALGRPVTLRTTLQRQNYRELARFISLARELDAARLSFLTVDIGNAQAFGRSSPLEAALALAPEDVVAFADIVEATLLAEAAAFATGFVAESPAKLRRMVQYFAALNGAAPYPPVRCNAPEFSAVLGADGRLSPCFFIAGPAPAGADGVASALNGEALTSLRRQVRDGEREECRRCVCSMYRDPARAFADE